MSRIYISARLDLARWVQLHHPQLEIHLDHAGLYVWNRDGLAPWQSGPGGHPDASWLLLRNDRRIVSYNGETDRRYTSSPGPMGRGWTDKMKVLLGRRFEKLWGVAE